MPTRIMLLSAVALLSLISACSDDPASPETFSLTIRVTDADDLPVEGLTVCLENEIDPHPWGFPAPGGRPVNVVKFDVQDTCDVDMVVRDVLGDVARELVMDYEALPGTHVLAWNGTDADGERVPPGYYEFHMTARADGAVAFRDTVDGFMWLYDLDQLAVGVTDANGQLVIDDRRRFPGLFDLGEMMGRNEDSEPTGVFTAPATVMIALRDLDRGLFMPRTYHDYADGANVVDLLWDPEAARPLAAPENGEVGATIRRVSAMPPLEYRLEPPYPNPFN